MKSAVILLALVFASEGSLSVNSSEYQLFAVEELKKELYLPETWPSKSFDPGLSRYRQPLEVSNKYLDSAEANEELINLMKELEKGWDGDRFETYCTRKQFDSLIALIKKYPSTSQAVTAKLLLGKMLSYAFCGNTLTASYWGLEILREVYDQFSNKWQGKVALYYYYLFLFYPTFKYNSDFTIQYLDDFDAICRELEKLYLSDGKDHQLKEFESYRGNMYFLCLDLLAESYCKAAQIKWAKDHQLSSEYYKKAQDIYLHMWKACKDNVYCPTNNSYLEMRVKWKNRRSTLEEGDHRCVPNKLD